LALKDERNALFAFLQQVAGHGDATDALAAIADRYPGYWTTAH
jgi:hypothetical protein